MSNGYALHPSLNEQGVLVVDDSVVQRDAITAQLRLLGVTNICTADNGHSALELLTTQQFRPSTICVDLEMPGMDGIELLQSLPSLGLRPAVVVMSGANAAVLESVGLMVETLGIPLLGILPKPVTLRRLSHVLLRREDKGLMGSTRHPSIPAMRVHELTAALAENRIAPYYQPKVSLKTGVVVGFEALARCTTLEGAVLPPAAFIETAEDGGLMDPLTLAMLDCVLRDLASWHACNVYPTISLNLSASSLADRQLGNEIMRRVEAARISPTALILEITESALVTDLANALGVLGRLRLKGFGLSLDDYGTGFSSLQQLDRLPFTELKIDRSFVACADQKEGRRRILASAVRTGEQLHLVTVAEGVETVEELHMLRDLGCQQVQGYLIAPPMPPKQVLPWLADRRDMIRDMCLIE